MSGGLVDVHTHYLPRELVAALELRDDLPRVSGPDDARVIEYGHGNVHPVLPAMSDLDLRLEEMDRDGIEVAVLTINVPGVDWFPVGDGAAVARAVNDELADVVAAHPGRLEAMAALPMQDPEAAAAELVRTNAAGFKGGLVFSNVAGRSLDEPRFRVVFDTAAELDVPIFIHPTYPLSAATVDAHALIPTLGFLMDTTTAALRLVLDGLYARHPRFKLVLAHSGSLLPQLAGRIDYEAERAHNGHGALDVPPSEHLRLIYTDTVCVWPPALRSAIELVGDERVMFGSDYPFWDARRTIETIAASGFGPASAARVRSLNARAVYGLEAVAGAAGKPAPPAGLPR
jgi:aminocarboxymuconate-semialdehyde decarboxylase